MQYVLVVFAALLWSFGFVGCAPKPLEPVAMPQQPKRIDYMSDVKPILDRRCVVCHSCYNAPCQLKLSSFEGFERGASKMGVYDTRLEPVEPTRLFFDAQTKAQWRKRDFYSVIQNDLNQSHNNSVMLQMLQMKAKYPEAVGEYRPETETWSCPKNSDELAEFFDEKGNHRGMPYGFPALKSEEFMTLKAWVAQGAFGPTYPQDKALKTPSQEVAPSIAKWEAFLNAPDAKHVMSARYLYEHLYLAHIYFAPKSDEFYELVRSKTPAPEPIDVIATVRPYDDPKVERVYYRFRKIHATLVHKTHMVMRFDDTKLERLKTQFIHTPWLDKPYTTGYGAKRSANPFLTFAQIPPAVRYQFLLDNAHYIVMTFIRGPVCRGQVALASIHDHFWVFFQDPKYDLSLQRPSYLIEQAQKLSMPIENGSDYRLYKIFTDKYLKRYKSYFRTKVRLYDEAYPAGIGYEGIYKGERSEDAPMLSIYRHFDSASVHKGALGKLPRTAWVVDYPLFERIYYTLVTGYDVFGNVSHQANVRRFMDFLRYEGELNFIAYMPKERQLPMFKSWSKGDDEIESLQQLWKRGSGVAYRSDDPKREFIEYIVDQHLLPSTNITFDTLNYFRAHETIPHLPQQYGSRKDYENGFRAMTKPGTGFIRQVVDFGVNTIVLRIKMPDGDDKVISMVINRYHDNVSSLLNPDNTLDSSKDTFDFYEGFIGSYPNAFMVVDLKEMPEFFEMMIHYGEDPKYERMLRRFGISRGDAEFWEHFEWFQKRLEKEQPIEAGLLDLNRYYHSAWH